MELLTLILTSFLSLLSPTGFVVDRVAQKAIRSQFNKVEQLQVRVDNVPSYQLVQGKLERLRIAGRGLWLTPDARIAALELESDPIDVNIQRLRQSGRGLPTKALRQPLQAGVRLVLTEADLNKALQSPAVNAQMRELATNLLGSFAQEFKRYEFVNPRVDFLENNRIRLQVQLQQTSEGTTESTSSKQLAITLESGLGVVSGRQLQLIDPAASINGNSIPSLLLNPLVQSLNKQLDLAQLEEAGITARLLQLQVNPEQLELAAFVRVQPSTQQVGSQE